MIFIWKLSQGLVSGYNLEFKVNNRTGRWAVPANLAGSRLPSFVQKAKMNSLRV